MATVTGTGSHWEQDGSLTVGFFGTGTLTVEDGGRITSAAGHIGRFDSGEGSVTVDGADSRWEIEGPLYVGGNEDEPSQGQGELRITSGGGVTSEAAFISHNGGTGSVTVEGADSWWDAGDQATVGETDDGLLRLTDGGTVICDALHIGPEGVLTGEGTIDGSISNDGTVEPAGEIEVTGSYTQSEDAVLRTLIDADGAGRLTVDGTSEFDGTLEISLAPGYEPDSGDEFVIVSHSGSSGAFDAVLGDGFSPRYGATEMTVVYCLADWNGDGEVDISDFFAFLTDFEAGDPRADLNGDGQIDINDFFLFLAEFEKGC